MKEINKRQELGCHTSISAAPRGIVQIQMQVGYVPKVTCKKQEWECQERNIQ